MPGFCRVVQHVSASIRSGDRRPPQSIVLKPEIIRAMAGLGEFKHDAVAVVGVAGDHRETVIVIYIQFQVFFIDLSDLFHGHDALAVHNGHMESVFQVFVDGTGSDFRSQAGHGALQKIVMVQNQGLAVQGMDSLDIVELSSFGKTGAGCHTAVGGELNEAEHLSGSGAAVAAGRLLKGFDAADGEGRLIHRDKDIPHSFALDGLNIAVRDQTGDSPAQGIAGAFILRNQGIFGREELSLRKFAGFYF